MLMFLLTVTGILSVLLMLRSCGADYADTWQGLFLRLFGIASFILTAILTNGVAS